MLAAWDGQLLPGSSSLVFLTDYSVHIRFLVALPLLIVAELVVHTRMMRMIEQFTVRKLIPESELRKFNDAFESANRWRNSFWAESTIVVLVLVAGYQFVWKEAAAFEIDGWYNRPVVAGGTLSLAGLWFRFVSLPLFQLLLLRWYYRIIIWARFVFQVSGIRLQLLPTHPDHVGGLGFLSNSVHAFVPLALAHGTVLTAVIANKIAYQGASLVDFKIEIAVALAWVIFLVLPLLFFASQLADVKKAGTLEYGHLASHFSGEFERRWMAGEWPADHAQVGGDIQSLADLSNSYAVVENMRSVPVTRSAIVMLVAVTLAPIAPLVLTLMPLTEVLKILAGALI